MRKQCVRVWVIVMVAAATLPAVTASAQNGKMVVLARRGDVVSESLPTATNFFVKTILLGENDIAMIQARANFTPRVRKLKFFYGEDPAGQIVGTVLFSPVETNYGPMEVGTAVSPGGTVTNVVITRTAPEAEPIVKRLIRAGILKDLTGLKPNSTASLTTELSKKRSGTASKYMTQVVASAVIRTVIYYNMLFSRYVADTTGGIAIAR